MKLNVWNPKELEMQEYNVYKPTVVAISEDGFEEAVQRTIFSAELDTMSRKINSKLKAIKSADTIADREELEEELEELKKENQLLQELSAEYALNVESHKAENNISDESISGSFVDMFVYTLGLARMNVDFKGGMFESTYKSLVDYCKKWDSEPTFPEERRKECLELRNLLSWYIQNTIDNSAGLRKSFSSISARMLQECLNVVDIKTKTTKVKDESDSYLGTIRKEGSIKTAFKQVWLVFLHLNGLDLPTVEKTSTSTAFAKF